MTLTCTASSVATITSYKWYKGTDVLAETSSTLTLSNVQQGDAANYKCDALITTVSSDSSADFAVTVLGM